MSDSFTASIVSSFVGLAPGAVGGFCSVCVGHPIDLIKVRQQTAAKAPSVTVTAGSELAINRSISLLGSSSTIGMLRNIFVKDGVAGLYRGVTAPLLAVTPAFAVSFWSYDLGCRAVRSYSNNTSSQLSIVETSLAGGFSGLPLAVIFGPSERIKCLMQVDKGKYTGFMDCLRQVYQEGGIRSVFRGTTSTVYRDVPGNAAYFAGYEYVKRLSCQIEQREQPSRLGILMAGGCAGVANWIVAIPFDTVKSRWQTAPAGTYNSLLHVLQTLLQTEGPKALFRGLSPALLRAFPANAACLSGVEAMKSVLSQH